MIIIAALKEIRALIERGWCKGIEAREANGHNVMPEAKTAREWCLFGAIVRVCGYGSTSMIAISRLLRELSPNKSYIRFNDDEETTKQDVLDLIDKAIKAVL